MGRLAQEDDVAASQVFGEAGAASGRDARALVGVPVLMGLGTAVTAVGAAIWLRRDRNEWSAAPTVSFAPDGWRAGVTIEF